MQKTNIQIAREEKGLSRAEFSRIFEIPYRTAQDWELNNSKCPIYLEKLILEKLEKIEKKHLTYHILCFGTKPLSPVGSGQN